MHIPCLKDLVETFKEEIYNLDYDYFRTHQIDIDIHLFSQTWGSTALGFSGMGGQSITSAYTTVICDRNSGYYGVFFATRLGYTIKDPNDIFFDDLKFNRMKPVSQQHQYIRG